MENEKNMKEKILIIAFLCAQFVGFSQWRKVEKLERDRTPSLKLGFSAKHNFINPGMKIGAEFMMSKKTVTIKDRVKTKEKSLVTNLSFFNDPDLYNNAILSVEWIKRTHYGNSSFFFSRGAAFGVGRIINRQQPATYVKNTDGTETTKAVKNDFIMLDFNAGLGYDFMPKMNKPIKIYANAVLQPLYYNAWPYGAYLKPEIGIITSLSAFKKK